MKSEIVTSSPFKARLQTAMAEKMKKENTRRKIFQDDEEEDVDDPLPVDFHFYNLSLDPLAFTD